MKYYQMLQIEDVKRKIEEKHGTDFPAANQVVIYQGKVGMLLIVIYLTGLGNFLVADIVVKLHAGA